MPSSSRRFTASAALEARSTAARLAIVRVRQRVSPFGMVSSVLTIAASTSSSTIESQLNVWRLGNELPQRDVNGSTTQSHY